MEKFKMEIPGARDELASLYKHIWTHWKVNGFKNKKGFNWFEKFTQMEKLPLFGKLINYVSSS